MKGSKGEGMQMLTEDRIYTVDELKDLQGKLNLVVGKKQKQGGQAQIEYFIEVRNYAVKISFQCRTKIAWGYFFQLLCLNKLDNRVNLVLWLLRGVEY